MYIDTIEINNFRTFEKSKISFTHPDQDFDKLEMPRPRLPNVNLILGTNGLGKTTLLKAVALAALGPAVSDSGIFPYRLIRREPKNSKKPQPQEATIRAVFTPHEQDRTPHEQDRTPHEQDRAAGGGRRLESAISILRRGDLESMRWTHPDDELWQPIFSSTSDAFFFVGYGATRRVEKQERTDLGGRRGSAFVRAQRVQSLFEEAHSLIPLNAWLPSFETKNKGRFTQTANLVNRLLGREHYIFTKEMEDGEYLFNKKGLEVPFPALSDGYRAFLGWVGDLLYHVCMTCPSGKKLVDNKGIVMVDEIDLHLHPKWQMNVLSTLAEKLPNIQFIVTTHSPLIVGALEWMNIIAMTPGPRQSSIAQRMEQAVHGLDADQVLLTDYFGLESTRTPGKTRTLKELTARAREGDTEAAKLLLEHMTTGLEGSK